MLNDVLGMILSEACGVTLSGVAVGLAAALLLTRFLSTMLFGLKPNDPIAMMRGALLLVLVSMIAAFVPALRASRFEPIQALRHE